MAAPETLIDPDFLGDTLAAVLLSLQTAASFSVSAEPGVFKALQKEIQIWEQTCLDLETQIHQLEAQGHSETTGYYLNLRPVIQHRDYLLQLAQACRQFQEIEAYLLKEMAEVKEASLALAKQILPFHLPKFEAGQEQFMDRCDALADRLDGLEAQGYNIAPLVTRYEQWIAMIEQFGDILDERTEALVLKRS